MNVLVVTDGSDPGHNRDQYSRANRGAYTSPVNLRFSSDVTKASEYRDRSLSHAHSSAVNRNPERNSTASAIPATAM